MNSFFYFLLGGFIFLGVLGIFALPAESDIPPTPAFKIINSTSGNVTANNYRDTVEFIEGSGILISANYSTNKITFSSTASGNPTELYCSGTDKFNSYNSTTNTFTCDTDISGAGGEANTASNVGLGYGLFKQKTGIDLEFLNIFCAGDLLCSTNATDFRISYAAGSVSSGLDDLTDVIITSPAYLSTLFYDGVNWIDKIFSINNQSSVNGNFITGINNQTGIITTQTFKGNTISCSGTNKFSAYDNQTGLYTCSTDVSGGATARENLVGHFEIDRTWTNIGVNYVDTYATAEGVRIDTNGMTTVTLEILWTKVGAGTQRCQIVDATNAANILIVLNGVISGTNTNATQTIPIGLVNTIKTYEPQCMSTTSTDDPIWLSGSVLLR